MPLATLRCGRLLPFPIVEIVSAKPVERNLRVLMFVLMS
jgi:hypothetical protein